jgi:hypothetical protein
MPVKAKPNVDKKTIEDLFTQAYKELGFTEEKVRQILKSKNHTAFKTENYSIYLADIRYYAEEIFARQSYPEVCPICQGAVVRRMDRDRHYGVFWGWDCSIDRFHFWDDRAHDLAKHIAKWNTNIDEWLKYQKDLQEKAHLIEVQVNQ